MHLLAHPRGGGIAIFIRKINNAYAKYYNRTYNRRGYPYRRHGIIDDTEIKTNKTVLKESLKK